MVGVDGNSRVLDFGIAQAALRSHVTAAGTVKGKIAYMSPEQAQGLAVDARTDVFAAGVVLWEVVTGRRLFFAPDSRDALELLLTSRIPAPSSIVPSLPPALDAVVLRALERDRELRFPSARDFAEALRAAVDEGSRKEVADWVARVAKDGLAERLQLLQALEASALETKREAALPTATRSSVRAAAPPPSPGAEQTQAQVTVTTSLLPQPQVKRAPYRRAWWAGSAAVLAASLAVWLFRTTPAAAPAAARPPSFAAASTVMAQAAPPPPRPAASPAVDAPPVVEADRLPLAPSSAPPVPMKRLPPRETPTAASKKSCSPPYRIDASGVRRVKPECL
jgi:serine/threonine-protein kinase